jgi:hypothetical protein
VFPSPFETTRSAALSGSDLAPAHAVPVRSRAADRRMWIVVVLLLAGLFALFRTFVIREVAWAYPADYDQTKYLWFTYAIHESVLRNGLAAGLREWFFTPYSNGMLIHLQALMLMLVFGASRLTLLSVNFAAMAAYLVVITAVVRNLTGSTRMALLALGLAIGTGRYWFMNQVDYRLDFSSLCFFGIFVSLVMRSAVFRDRRWAVLAGVAAAVLIANRFLTSLYVAGIYAGMLAYFGVVCPWLIKRREPAALRNVAISALVGAALSVPIVWISLRAIYDYYVVQQGMEKAIRDIEFSVDGLLQFWLYYPTSLIVDHVGPHLAAGSVLVLGVCAASAWRGRSRRRAAQPAWFADAWVFLVLGSLAIMGALTANITRSPVVGGIAVPLFTWGVVLAAMALLQREDGTGTPAWHGAAAAAAALALVATLSAQVAFFGSHYRFWRNGNDVREIARMYDDIGRYANQMQWSAAVIASDSSRDYLIGSAVTAKHYESTGRLVVFGSALATAGVMAPPREVLLTHLGNADFLILTHRRDAGEPPYPIVEAVEAMRTDLQAASSRLLPLGEYRIFGRAVNAYARPVVRIVGGVSGGWITTDGLDVEVPRIGGLGGQTELIVTGSMNPWIAPDVSASCESSDGGPPRPLPGGLTTDKTTYVARCALPSAGTDGRAPLRVRVSFSRYFVPREKGINEDVRRLVLAAPLRMDVVPRATPDPVQKP